MGKSIISNHYKALLGKMIKDKAPEKAAPETEAGIFESIHLLAEEKVSFGDEKVRWLALNTKKMIAKMMDAASFVTYDVKRNGNIVSCEAKFYWSDDADHPAGTGFVARDVTKRITSDADASAAETEIEALVRGAAASRALTDAGIGIEFYSDSFDTLFSSVEESEAEEAAQRKQQGKADELKRLVPEVPSKEELKKKARANATAKEAKTEKSAQEKAGEPVKAAQEPAEEKVAPATEVAAPTTEAPAQEPAEVPAPAYEGTMDAGKAKLVATTKGNYAGQPLGIVQSARPMALVWYAANDTPEVCEAAKAIILAEHPELIERLNKALGNK